MTQPISKSERFVREHYPNNVNKGVPYWQCVYLVHSRKQNNTHKFIILDLPNSEPQTIGTGLTRLEAWRDAARNIRNSLKQQP